MINFHQNSPHSSRNDKQSKGTNSMIDKEKALTDFQKSIATFKEKNSTPFTLALQEITNVLDQ